MLDINRSYLPAVEDDLPLQNVAIFKTRDGRLEAVRTPSFSEKPSLIVLEITPVQSVRLGSFVQELAKKFPFPFTFHLIIDPCRCLNARVIPTMLIYPHVRKILSKNNWDPFEVYGVKSDPWRSELVLSMKRNIFGYVENMAYRYMDKTHQAFH